MILLCFKILMGVEKMHLIWSCENIRCIYIKIFAYLYQFSVTSNMETFKRSFLIYAGTLWNDLPDRMKNACSFKSFKQNLSSRRDTKVYYYFGKRWPSIHHARLCIGCCKLKSHLSHNLHILTKTFNFVYFCPGLATCRPSRCRLCLHCVTFCCA